MSVIGSGGREYALALKLAQSPQVEQVYIAPGNGGTEFIGENIPIPANDISAQIAFAKQARIDLTVVGPDDCLAAGIVDAFRVEGLRIFGPTKAAAQIESSKCFAKQLMDRQAIPTAKYQVFDDYKEALAYVRMRNFGVSRPLVIKADGLALGKGAITCVTLEEMENALIKLMIEKVFGPAGETVVIEDFLTGHECSAHFICSNGPTFCSFVAFPLSADHKRVGDGDTGEMTGGMGTIAPVPWAGGSTLRDIIGKKIAMPILSQLHGRGMSFSGCIFPGVMMTEDGPKVLECNARFGDPETQVYMPLLESDLLPLLEASADGKDMADVEVKWRKGHSACVILASGGYPNAYKKGVPIHIDAHEIAKLPCVDLIHAGTTWKDGQLVTDGGRVMGVRAYHENSLEIALMQAYEAIKHISFEGMQYRTDIGKKAFEVASKTVTTS